MEESQMPAEEDKRLVMLERRMLDLQKQAAESREMARLAMQRPPSPSLPEETLKAAFHELGATSDIMKRGDILKGIDKVLEASFRLHNSVERTP